MTRCSPSTSALSRFSGHLRRMDLKPRKEFSCTGSRRQPFAGPVCVASPIRHAMPHQDVRHWPVRRRCAMSRPAAARQMPARRIRMDNTGLCFCGMLDDPPRSRRGGLAQFSDLRASQRHDVRRDAPPGVGARRPAHHRSRLPAPRVVCHGIRVSKPKVAATLCTSSVDTPARSA